MARKCFTNIHWEGAYWRIQFYVTLSLSCLSYKLPHVLTTQTQRVFSDDDHLSNYAPWYIPQRSPPGQADATLARRDEDLPGAAHLRQQRDERAAQRAGDRAPPSAARHRRVRRHLVPLARGPRRQATLPGHRHGRQVQHEHRRPEPQLGEVLRRGRHPEGDAASLGDRPEDGTTAAGGR